MYVQSSHNIIRHILLFAFVLFATLFFSNAYAITDDFKVRTLVGAESIPPTVPSNLTATPIATTQIDLSWGTSTDDFLLSGYHVWRDSVQIATTTLTTYSDVGLTASTLYTYYVTAYDSFFNESASSTLVSTSTLSAPTPPATSTPSTTATVTRGSKFYSFDQVITHFTIIPSENNVVIEFNTSLYIKPVVRWGKETSYELGSSIGRAFSKEHKTVITSLTPGTRYYLSIEGETTSGDYGVLHEGTFTTLSKDNMLPPSNVRFLTAAEDGSNVRLRWQNPRDPDFTKVRVVRNPNFYPSDIADGWVVYEGSAESANDIDILKENAVVYYTVFAYNAKGNISSGAVTYVKRTGDTLTSVVKPEVEINPLELTFYDVIFTQEGKVLPTVGTTVSIDGSKSLIITIPYDRFPEHLKTILVSIYENKELGKEFTFLLRVNSDKTAYTSTIAPFGVNGDFPVRVSVFNYKTQQLGFTEGLIHSRMQHLFIREDEPNLFALLVGDSIFPFVTVAILLFLGMSFGVRIRKKGHVH